MTFNAGIEAAALNLPEIPDDDADFTPDLARKIVARYQEIIVNVTTSAINTREAYIAMQERALKSEYALTRPSSSAPVELREAVARIIAKFDWPVAPESDQQAWVEKNWRKHLPLADAILSLPGSSRDEVLEEAANWHDAEAELAINSLCCADGSSTIATAHRRCSWHRQSANAIRALKSGVAK